MPSTPVSHWIGFHIFVFALMATEYLYIRWQRSKKPADETLHSTSVAATILWVGAALVFALFVLRSLGGTAATQYLAGYAIEEALSIDNLFVFLLLFKLFRIEPANQPRVLFWGVAGAIVMRGAFIAAGLELLARFEWVSYVFAVILLIASIRLVLPEDEKQKEETPPWLRWISQLRPVSLRQDRFLVRENGQRMATVLMLALIAIEVTDLVFAIDSIPAVLSITRHPFLAYTSNIMAVMGLRSLYFLLAHLLTKLRYLHYGLAAVLAFAALKMLSSHFIEIGPLVSLGVVAAMLAITIGLSLIRKPTEAGNA
ncbi:TerC/Alx family metal homeostasis membrane protein [Edaphobacter albus]|uniref:TerC/Alx family metal homeostasis membrane protein n=1 Tax=Edaphobacter sp. 4G125 TaxID=2763071 RepID=UPI0016465EB6|nr:TerC/Alx family metal homeostasis membrane protein [Edaphobacter sp. 4G125]QNI38030.1 TerC/Alx family metal homeostasis membrane protein [Edaphobacter sp. 4G125]